MTDAEHEVEIGWPRAIASALVILIVGIGIAIYGSNEVLTRATGLSRGNREYVASAVFFLTIAGVATVLRRLQRRNLI